MVKEITDLLDKDSLESLLDEEGCMPSPPEDVKTLENASWELIYEVIDQGEATVSSKSIYKWKSESETYFVVHEYDSEDCAALVGYDAGMYEFYLKVYENSKKDRKRLILGYADELKGLDNILGFYRDVLGTEKAKKKLLKIIDDCLK